MSTCISILLVGCQSDNSKNSLPLYDISETSSPIKMEQDSQDFFKEVLELEEKYINVTKRSLDIKGQVSVIEVDKKQHLSINIVFDKPKKKLKNALVLAIFDSSLDNYVIADYPYVTSFLGKAETIYPNKDPKGFEVGRAFPMQNNLFDQETFINIFDDVKFLLVYEDEFGDLQREYFISTKDDFTIDHKLLDRIK
jgi:hypothetical protein